MDRRDALKLMAAGLVAPAFRLPVLANVSLPQNIFPTGWRNVDEALGGGFKAGSILVLHHTDQVSCQYFVENLIRNNHQTSRIKYLPFVPPAPPLKPTFFNEKAASCCCWYRKINNNLRKHPDRLIVTSHRMVKNKHSDAFPPYWVEGGQISSFCGTYVIKMGLFSSGYNPHVPRLINYKVTKNRSNGCSGFSFVAQNKTSELL